MVASLRGSMIGMLVVGQMAAADVPQQARPTVAQVFGEKSLDGPKARTPKLSPDGTKVAYLREDPKHDNVLDLWVADTVGHPPVRLVAGGSLSTSRGPGSGDAFDRRERLRIRNNGVTEYVWDKAGKRILLPADEDLWIADVGRHSLSRVTNDADEEIDPRFSPRGHFVSFVRERNLFLLDLTNSRVRQLTTGGGGPKSWGLAEFVAQEEMRRSSGYWWSPDERFIAAEHVDESGVDLVPRVVTDASGTRVVEERYPRAGRPNAKITLSIIDVASGRSVPASIDIGSDYYLARANWSRDGSTLFLQRQSRDQKTLDVIAVEAATGAARILFSEKSPNWIELSDDFYALNGGGFLWTSERDGNRHIYLFDSGGKVTRQVTRGNWPVSAIEGVNERTQTVYFSASKETPLERDLYAASYAKIDEPRRISTGEGWWRFAMSEEPRAYIGTYSDPKTPPSTGLYSADGRFIRWIEHNQLIEGHPYWPFVAGLPRPQYGTLKAEDGQTLYYSLQLPTDFNPARRYPAIVSVYGGPMVQTVRKQWGDPADRLLLDRGFVLFRLDNRGSANRSVAFKTAIAGKLGQAETRDQMLGANYLASLPFVDPARIGVLGWSFGGFMSLMLLTEAKSPFASGVAGAAPSDWRLYDTHYTERFLGLPQINTVAYDAVDISKRVGNLEGRLLLVQGMADDNVTFDNAVRVSNALQNRGIVFQQMFYPGEAHLLRGGAKQRHLWRTYLDFFERTLGTSK